MFFIETPYGIKMTFEQDSALLSLIKDIDEKFAQKKDNEPYDMMTCLAEVLYDFELNYPDFAKLPATPFITHYNDENAIDVIALLVPSPALMYEHSVQEAVKMLEQEILTGKWEVQELNDQEILDQYQQYYEMLVDEPIEQDDEPVITVEDLDEPAEDESNNDPDLKLLYPLNGSSEMYSLKKKATSFYRFGHKYFAEFKRDNVICADDKKRPIRIKTTYAQKINPKLL